MKLSKSNWMYRVYRWYRQNTSTMMRYEDKGANLCSFFRAVFLLAPLRWLFTGRIFGVSIGSVTLPLLFWAVLLTPWFFGNPSGTVGLILISLFIFLNIGFGLGLVWFLAFSNFSKWAEKHVDPVAEIFWEKAHSVHTKVCPWITFTD